MLQTVSTGLSEAVPPLTLIMVVNASDMDKLARQVAAPWEGSAFMLLPAQNILQDPGAHSTDLIRPDTCLNTLTSDENYTVATHVSDIASVVYVLSLPNERFFGELFSVRALFAYFFVCTLVLGLLLAYFLARRNYKPLEDLKQTVDLPVESSEDVFAAITRHLREMKDDRDQMQQEIHRL